MISILVLTKNEEADLPGCLASVSWSDDVHVLDSCSDDATAAIAEAAGARVTLRPFDNWAAHQNWALGNLPFRHPWVLYVDADERVTLGLKEAALRAAAEPGDRVAFRVRRRDFFLGRWLRHVQASPYYLRLFRPEKMRYERLVNPVSLPDGPVGELAGYLDHYPFSKGIGHWVDRHNKYSLLEARQVLANRASGQKFSLRSAFFEPDFHKKRFHQKELFYRLPLRPFVKFFTLYVLKRGFLDGRAGLRYSILQSIYEYLIVMNVEEIQAAANAQAAPPGRTQPTRGASAPEDDRPGRERVGA